jgi:transposase
MIASLPIPVYDDKTIIGIDDFAFRKGISYGSIIIDAEKGRPIDLIESRDEPEVSSWLKKHPEIKIVTRDRASSYSKAIRSALPFSVQVADRFHIVKNLSERLYETIKVNYPKIKEEFISFLNEQKPEESSKEVIIQTNTEDNTREASCGKTGNGVLNLEAETQKAVEKKEVLYNRIHELLHNGGMSSRKIASALHVNKETVLI